MVVHQGFPKTYAFALKVSDVNCHCLALLQGLCWDYVIFAILLKQIQACQTPGAKK